MADSLGAKVVFSDLWMDNSSKLENRRLGPQKHTVFKDTLPVGITIGGQTLDWECRNES